MKIASPFLQNQQNPFLCACRKSAQKLPCGAGSTLHAGWSFFLYEKSVLHESDCLRGSGQEVCTDSPSCLRNVRTSASSSRMRCCSRLRRLAWPIWIPDAFSQLRSVSIQIVAASLFSLFSLPYFLPLSFLPYDSFLCPSIWLWGIHFMPCFALWGFLDRSGPLCYH